jgi:TonB family protein
MRPILAASLLLSPVLFAASAIASQPKIDAPATTTEYHRISTGVAAPAIIDDASFRIPADALRQTGSGNAKVVLSLSVDEKGNAQNVHVLKSANPELDSRVIAAVLQSHFHPATLDHKAIAVDMDLTVSVQR